MIVSDLNSFLMPFYNDTIKSKAILIDGRWGCGKTYNIKEFIRTNNVNAIYLSLFGVKNCNEIIVKLSEYLDSTYIDQIDNRFLLKDSFDERDYNNAIVVLDDLERIESSIFYTEIFGLVDKLKRLGFKVICICDSLSINDSSFNDYNEKTFDDVINVESDKSLISTISGLGIKMEDTLLKTVSDNWRIIQKGKIYYDSICEEFKNNDCVFSEAMNYPNDILFRCVVLATQCVYSNRNSITGQMNDYQRIIYNNDKEKYGELVANELHYIFLEEKENNSLRRLVSLFIGSIKKHDYSMIVTYSKPTINDSVLDKYPYNKEIFFLDDKTYNEYKESFMNDINEFDFSKETHLRVLGNFLNNYCDELNEEETNIIIKRMVLTIDITEVDMLLDRLTVFREEPSLKLNDFKAKLKEQLLKHNDNETAKNIEKAIDENDYDTLTSVLYENRWATEEKKENLLKTFENKSFGLPDLSKEINHSSWTFCHEIAKFLSGTTFENAFVECLKNQCSKSNSKQLRRRCNALVSYNIKNNTKFD